jgi:hypothetical protein
LSYRIPKIVSQGGGDDHDEIPVVAAAAAGKRDRNATTSSGALKLAALRTDETERALRRFQVLLNATRLYERHHPHTLRSLDDAYEAIRGVSSRLKGFEIRIGRGQIAVPKHGDEPLADAHGELRALARELERAGIHTVAFGREFHVGELDTMAQLVRSSLLTSEENAKHDATKRWASLLSENRVEGITVNTQSDRRVDSVLASMIAALVAYGGTTPREGGDKPIAAPGFDELVATLGLLARLTPPMEAARGISPEEAARAIHSAMEAASRDTVRLLLSSISQYSPREGEEPQPYFLRLSENLIFEFLGPEFSAGALTPIMVRPMLHRLGGVLVNAGKYSGPHSSSHLSSFANTWASDTYREKLIDKFWLEMPPREKSAVLKGPDIWCVPIVALRQNLAQLAEAGADAPRREARSILLNYARRIEHEESLCRRSVAAGLNELTAVIESLWPNQVPEDLSKGTLTALEKERTPETAALLAAFLETLGRIAVNRGDYAGFETILTGLERAPKDKEHDHMTNLARRMVAQDRWLLLVDAAFANRALDPVLPRLLQRDPERLLDRMSLLLTEPSSETIPGMARLLRTIGVPVLNLLEARLYDSRKQRVSAAIKLLAATDPERLLRGVERAIAAWEWNLQDLAVSELSRPTNSASAQSAAGIFSRVLADAHPLVVPMMIDQIGLAMEFTAVPQLMEIASGEHELLRDQFVRIKAIEALGRMRAVEAIELLRSLAEKREGITYVEPGGLRAAAEDALAMMEDRPSSARARKTFEAAAQASANFVIPRRYVRVPLESPLRAQIEGAPAPQMARVKTISLGGAYLESPKKLSVGDSIKLEIRAGFRKLNFTAVVRNIGTEGNGVEFVHMKDEDREKLRKLVQKNLQL